MYERRKERKRLTYKRKQKRKRSTSETKMCQTDS